MGLLDTSAGCAFAQHEIDDVTRDALLRQLRAERAMAARLEALALLDPPASERLVVDVTLGAQAVDRVVDRLDLELLRPKVTMDLRDGVRSPGQVTHGGLVGVAGGCGGRPNLPRHPGSRRPPPRRTARAPSPRSRLRRRRARAGTASPPRDPVRCAPCRS